MLRGGQFLEPWRAVDNIGRLTADIRNDASIILSDNTQAVGMPPWTSVPYDVSYGADFATFMDGMMVPELELPIMDDIF